MELIISISVQIILFIPFYITWLYDCKKIGKENLAVSLGKRFLYWIVLCPIWALPFLNYLTKQ